MIVSGAKHACATCIRGHRSSSCTHADRPLFEIRKKGRPVSQCPHCRDLRKIKSCHTKCECGETAAEQSKTSKCKCHTGLPCSCAGPVQVYQYIPPELSSASSTSATNSSSDGTRTPNGPGSMLHVFQASAIPNSANQIKMQNAMPYPTAQLHREHSHSRTASTTTSVEPTSRHESIAGHPSPLPALPMNGSPAETDFDPTNFDADHSWSPQRSIPITRNIQALHPGPSSISRSTRSIGTNTEPLPPGIWPDDLFALPTFMLPSQSQIGATPAAQLQSASTPMSDVTHQQSRRIDTYQCPKLKDMPLDDIKLSSFDLASSSNPVPTFSTFYTPQFNPAGSVDLPQAAPNTLAIDHFFDYEDFDPDDLERLFDVPGCSLPGVQCRCGDNCSCAGCQTHKDNKDHVAFAEFEQMDFSDGTKKRNHPEGCCDTRVLHMQPPDVHASDQIVSTIGVHSGGCCGSS